MPGLVPGIPMEKHCAQSIGITGTSPVMTTESDAKNFVASAPRNDKYKRYASSQSCVSITDSPVNTSLGFVARDALRVV
ncbi:MAG: hypothetical protein V4458_07965 [Pseudomonadota bacterium]|nr:hypothetical protein [Afipia sp.]